MANGSPWPWLFGLLVAGFLGSEPGGDDQRRQPPGTPVETDSGSGAFRSALAQTTSPEMERRKAARRLLQQRGYAAILAEVLQRDGPGALLMSLRTKAQLDYGLPSHTLYVYIPVTAPARRDGHLSILQPPSSPPMAVPLQEDFTFPSDPWAP